MIDRRAMLGLGGSAAVGLLLYSRAGKATAGGAFRCPTPAEWRRLLGPQRYAVLREAATERAYEPAPEGASQGLLHLRRMRAASVRLIHQVRKRHRMAELLARASKSVVNSDRQKLAHGADGGAVLALRRPRARVR